MLKSYFWNVVNKSLRFVIKVQNYVPCRSRPIQNKSYPETSDQNLPVTMSVLSNLAKYPKMLYLVIMLSAVGGFLFGYDTGVIAGALPLVEKTDGFFPEDPSKYILKLIPSTSSRLQIIHLIISEKADDWESGITAATVGAAFIFSFVGGFVTNRY